MGAHWLHDIAVALTGLPTNFYGGWETRSRSSGGFDAILGIAVHHTASKTSPESDMNYMWNGSPDRPVGNIYLARDGNIWVGTAGASNTQGKGGPLNCLNGTVPKDKGNQYMIAIEAANNGVGEPWPQVQTDNYVRMVRQLCEHYRLSFGQDVYGHFDYCAPSCPGRKVDPAGPSPFGSVNANHTWDINAFRAAVVNSALTPQPEPPTPEEPPEEDEDMTRSLLVQIADGPMAGGLFVAPHDLSRMTWLGSPGDYGALMATGSYDAVSLSGQIVSYIPGFTTVDIINE
ncbi:MAG: N-acetylmuramoyl-L-alanine amidase [Paenisporosarcina sp.]